MQNESTPMLHLLARGIRSNDVTCVLVSVLRVDLCRSIAKLHYWFFCGLKQPKNKTMVIQIKMDIQLNYAIIKYFKSYVVVIILVIKKVLDYSTIFPPLSYSVM